MSAPRPRMQSVRSLFASLTAQSCLSRNPPTSSSAPYRENQKPLCNKRARWMPVALAAARELRTWLPTDARKYWPAELCTEPQWYRAWEKNGPSENQIVGRALGAVQRSSPKQRPPLRLLGRPGLRRITTFRCGGGGSGIRTHDTVSRIHAFQACALSHSAIPPRCACSGEVGTGSPTRTCANSGAERAL